MSVVPVRAPLYRLTCDHCDQLTGLVSDTDSIVRLALQRGWTTNGEAHHCPECPPLLEVCS